MAAQTSTTARTSTVRGQGMVYVGSVESAHGARVRSMSDCLCRICQVYGDSTDRVRALLVDGRVLDHARRSSFSR